MSLKTVTVVLSNSPIHKMPQIAVKHGGAISGFERICIRVGQDRPSSYKLR